MDEGHQLTQAQIKSQRIVVMVNYQPVDLFKQGSKIHQENVKKKKKKPSHALYFFLFHTGGAC